MNAALSQPEHSAMTALGDSAGFALPPHIFVGKYFLIYIFICFLFWTFSVFHDFDKLL